MKKHKALIFYLLALGTAVYFILNIFTWYIAGWNPVIMYTVLLAWPATIIVAVTQIRKIPTLRMRRMLRGLLFASLLVAMVASAGQALRVSDGPQRQYQSNG
ncbi:MAG: hypothetical protein AAF206_10295 [Bacteroidota bacterium]